jgi:hypothetical protein
MILEESGRAVSRRRVILRSWGEYNRILGEAIKTALMSIVSHRDRQIVSNEDDTGIFVSGDELRGRRVPVFIDLTQTTSDGVPLSSCQYVNTSLDVFNEGDQYDASSEQYEHPFIAWKHRLENRSVTLVDLTKSPEQQLSEFYIVPLGSEEHRGGYDDVHDVSARPKRLRKTEAGL